MQLKRIFSAACARGTENYLNTQKKYELLRTAIYFAISASLFIAGFIQTKTRANLLTIVAVLGCLPACKSMVSAIMFLRFKSCSAQVAEEIKKHAGELAVLFDCVFTSYKKNYKVSHLAVRGNTVCGFTEDRSFEENEFYRHIGDILKADGHRDVTVRIFDSLPKYTERLRQMSALEEEPETTAAVVETLKSVML